MSRTGKKRVELFLQSPARAIALGFLVLILVGTALLSLPAASADGQSIGVFDAAFTATSAVCVTGLTVRSTALEFSRFGHVVLLMLIQCGALGMMTVASLIFMLLGRTITLRERMLIQESMNETGPGGMVRLIRWVALYTFSVELFGALLLAIRFIPEYGLGVGAFHAVFHAVSAFCNAGFDLFGDSLMRYSQDPIVCLTVMLLIVLGGLGFAVHSDVVGARSWKKLRLHTKVVLTGTGVLLVGGTAFFLAVEGGNPDTMGKMGFFGKLLASAFQSVTFRTAGFNSIDLMAMRPASKMFACLLMFVGAAPASTGGGVKVSTVAILLLTVRATLHGNESATAFKRTVPRTTVDRAIVIVVLGVFFLLLSLSALSLLEGGSQLIELAFEEFSALGTVGVSSFGTAKLSAVSRALIMVNMFVGRIGPLSLALALSRRQKAGSESIRFPEERIMVG